MRRNIKNWPRKWTNQHSSMKILKTMHMISNKCCDNNLFAEKNKYWLNLYSDIYLTLSETLPKPAERAVFSTVPCPSPPEKLGSCQGKTPLGGLWERTDDHIVGGGGRWREKSSRPRTLHGKKTGKNGLENDISRQKNGSKSERNGFLTSCAIPST